MGGVLNDPRVLAAGAGGLLSALATLWALNGLPLGVLVFWAAPLPLFAAGLGFGLPAAVGAAGVATAALAVSAGGLPVLVHLAGFGVPTLLLLAAGLRGQRIEPGLPLALLGLWPAAGILAAAATLAGAPGGLEGALRAAVEIGLDRMGLAAPEIAVAELVRVKAAAIGFWIAVALAANGALAQRLLARRGLALAPSPRWSEVRLPAWYPVLPAIGAAIWLAAGEQDAVPLSVMLVLLLPVFLQGVAAVHRRTRALRGRWMPLLLFYVLILVFSVPAALAVTALGLYEQWGRRAAPSGGNT